MRARFGRGSGRDGWTRSRPSRWRGESRRIGSKSLEEPHRSCEGARAWDATIPLVTTRTPPAASDFLHVEAPTCLRRTQGRETFAVGDGWVVKRTRERARAGLWPWFRARSSGEREFRALQVLAQSDVSVPRAVDWAEERSPSSRVSVCVMERVAHAETLRERLARARPAERRELARALLELIVRFHATGFVHRDLYLQHLLVRSEDGVLVLIDVGRVRRRPAWRPRWLVKDLASLLHSSPDAVSAREKLRFLAGWLDARGIHARGARRRWARAIESKRARIAAHVPKDERVGLP